MNFVNQSVESERCLLGCFLLNDSIVEKAVVRGFNHLIFSRHEHAYIAKAMIEMSNAGKPVDNVTCFEWLQRSGKAEEVGGLQYITKISQSVPSAANWSQYLDFVIDFAKRRDFAESLQSIIDIAHSDIDYGDLVNQADGIVSAMNSRSTVNMPITAGECLFQSFGAIDDRLNGLYRPLFCGISQLDDKIGGFERGQLITIAARSSHGKSAIALEMMLNMSSEYACAMLQLEMSNRDMGYRMTARLTGIGMDKLKKPERLSMVEIDLIGHITATMDIKRVPIKMHDQPSLSIEQITNYAKICKKSSVGLDVLVVDHLHLTRDMSGKKRRRDQELEEVTGGLKRLAKQLNIVVFMLAQCGKNVEGRPKLKDLRECASIEQDSDVVLLNYFPRKDIENYEHQTLFKLDVAKNRNGETGWIPLNFDGATQKVSNWRGTMNFDESPVKKTNYARNKDF